ncbi:SDR family oxidoreductase [Pseudoduganella sp. DS3]|uniref:SDR family oxidoreductase n=1 Tax=Pseudoduganella guangdongensis TaxID=2692179 RepID=A0A6N9HGK1_9BURK|nr:SDR family NAD(P)-dependent oxidoreductase [Pseudoduganella guangdongensis]MYN02499.1 SDR family oxidoreductase [Pseudoduganella guangdongensis]
MKKTVIVTGASSGLGFAIAKAYLARGYNVVGNARSLDRLQTAAAQLGHPDNFLLVAGDIAAPATAKALFEQAVARFGKVDILVNNAGIFIAKAAVDYSEADTDAIVATNLKGFLFPAQEAVRHMAAHGGGHIVNITASLGVTPAKATALLPVLVKGGLNMATRALALEVADKNIKVNAVAPGIISTPMHGKDAATQEFLKGLVPTKRMGSAEDIADAVLYLTDSTFISGHVLTVDDGAAAGNW